MPKLCLQEMKQSVKQMLQTLPEYCLVGLITFGAMVTGRREHSVASGISKVSTGCMSACMLCQIHHNQDVEHMMQACITTSQHIE